MAVNRKNSSVSFFFLFKLLRSRKIPRRLFKKCYEIIRSIETNREREKRIFIIPLIDFSFRLWIFTIFFNYFTIFSFARRSPFDCYNIKNNCTHLCRFLLTLFSTKNKSASIVFIFHDKKKLRPMIYGTRVERVTPGDDPSGTGRERD